MDRALFAAKTHGIGTVTSLPLLARQDMVAITYSDLFVFFVPQFHKVRGSVFLFDNGERIKECPQGRWTSQGWIRAGSRIGIDLVGLSVSLQRGGWSPRCEI
tara:strand:- start:7 stop:312 length:306 start_codon:yes stop_codon:yes gene_type:complete